MKYYLLFFAFSFKVISAYSAKDSILFSKSGNYVLEMNSHYDFLNSCSCNYAKLYEINKNESTYTIVFENDSVYFLHYEEPEKKTGRVFITKNEKNNEPCATLASVFKVISLPEYDSLYQFSLTSYLASDTVIFKNKTIKTYEEPLTDEDSIMYSSLHFDMNVGVLFNGKEFFNDTISTNVPEIEHHYKVYYSSDNNFYFVQGWYGYTRNSTIDLTTVRSYHSSTLNSIGRRKTN